MEIETCSGDWGLPAIEFNSLRVLALLKFSGVHAEVRKSSNSLRKSNDQFPVFRHHKLKLTTFQAILNHLQNQNCSPDIDLNAVNLSESLAYRTMIEEKLYPAVRYLWWVDEKNYIDLTRPWYARILPFPLNYYYPGRNKRENEKLFHSLHPDKEGKEIEHEVYREAEKCLTCLSIRLGENDFFYGNRPTSLDAVVYGCLAPLLKVPFPNRILQNHAKASMNLDNFVHRIDRTYFRQDAEEYEQRRRKENEVNSKNISEFLPNKRRNQILATLFAVTAFLFYGITTGILSISISNPDAESIIEYDDEESDSN